MTDFNIYQLILCIIVYVLMVVFLVTVILVIINIMLKLIYSGVEDENIQKEYNDNLLKQKYKRVRVLNALNRVTSLLFSCFVVILFVCAVAIKINEFEPVSTVPRVKVVASGSMSKKFPENVYLFRNKLDNQIQTFDIILLEQLPDEFDIKLYDVIMYQYEDTLIIHRVIGIEEPNEKHPDKRLFTFRGDNVEFSDRFMVEYSQMRGIYTGTRVPFVGSFIFFLQSPAGVLCIILILFALIALPLIEKKFNKAKMLRLKYLASLVPKPVLVGRYELFRFNLKMLGYKMASYIMPHVAKKHKTKKSIHIKIITKDNKVKSIRVMATHHNIRAIKMLVKSKALKVKNVEINSKRKVKFKSIKKVV